MHVINDLMTVLSNNKTVSSVSISFNDESVFTRSNIAVDRPTLRIKRTMRLHQRYTLEINREHRSLVSKMDA